MSSAAVGTHSGAGPLSLMSCVRESSPLQDFDSDSERNGKLLISYKKSIIAFECWIKFLYATPHNMLNVIVYSGKRSLTLSIY